MTHLSVWALEQAKRRPPVLLPSGYWVYLGKNLDKRDALVSTLGEKELLPLKDRLHRIAERLRQPFLNFIGELGREQPDQLGWWSSSCSWKDSVRSDLFLLICYEHLVGDLLRECARCGNRLVVVVEDPWLFLQLKAAYIGSPDIQFHGDPWLWPQCLKAIAWGIGARIAWSLRLLRNYLKQRWSWRWGKGGQQFSCSVAFYTDPQIRCIRGIDGWNDPYLGNLDAMLKKAGYSVLRFTPPEVGGLEKVIAQRSRYFAPLILWVTPLSLLRSVFSSWRPVWPSDPRVETLPLRWLLLRDWWKDRWRSSYLIFRVFFDCLRNLLKTVPLKLVIYPCENQPWEKMLVLAAREHGIATLGYQHGGGLARFTLPYFHGSGEAKWAPVPDVIVTSGHYSYELLEASGIPRERLLMGGNLRHQYLWNHPDSKLLPQAEGRIRVLVALPIEPDLVQHLIHALKKAFPDGGLSDGVEFTIKPHPMCPVNPERLRWPAAFVNGTFEEALHRCMAVLYSGSGTGLEALVMGRAVLRYRSELLLNMDRSEFVHSDTVIDCGDYDLREKVLSLLHTHSLSPSRQEVNDLLKRFFPRPDTAVWLEAIERLCSKRS